MSHVHESLHVPNVTGLLAPIVTILQYSPSDAAPSPLVPGSGADKVGGCCIGPVLTGREVLAGDRDVLVEDVLVDVDLQYQ